MVKKDFIVGLYNIIVINLFNWNLWWKCFGYFETKAEGYFEESMIFSCKELTILKCF